MRMQLARPQRWEARHGAAGVTERRCLRLVAMRGGRYDRDLIRAGPPPPLPRPPGRARSGARDTALSRFESSAAILLTGYSRIERKRCAARKGERAHHNAQSRRAHLIAHLLGSRCTHTRVFFALRGVQLRAGLSGRALLVVRVVGPISQVCARQCASSTPAALCAVQIYMGRSRVHRRCAQSSTEHMLQVCPRLAQMPKSFCLLACEARVLPLQGGRASGLLCRL